MPKRLSLIEEFKRRKVGRAFLAWAGSAVFVKEGVEILGPVMGLGDNGVRIVFFLVLLSFPAFLFFAWTFEVTDEGIEVTDEVDEEATPAEKAQRIAEAKRSGGVAAVAWIFLFVALGTFYLLDPGGAISNARQGLAAQFFNGINAEGVVAEMVEGGIRVDDDITVQFTGPVDPTSASSENVLLFDANGETVSAVVSGSGSEVTIDPRSPLQYGQEYRVVISDDFRAADGREVWDPLRQGPGSEFTFRTQPIPADGEHPRAALAADLDPERAPASGPYTLVFDTEIDPASAEQGIRLRTQDGAEVEIADLLISSGNREVRVEPASSLTRGGRYLIAVDSTLRAATGLPAMAVELPFRVTPPAPRRTQSAAPRPAPTGPGQLTLNITPAEALPFVKVVIDGDTVPTPVRGVSIAEGRSHSIRIVGVPDLSAYTMTVWERTVTPTPGQGLDLTASITPFGSVDIISEPAGTVFINGREVGRTPLAGWPVEAGVIHELEIRPLAEDADAYAPFTADFRVQSLEWRSLGRLELPPRGEAGG